jgi:2-polyprenyl-3-methyl-5-hydroxy-6-metoxy-1,4-benzoquinol methylase
MIAPMISRIAHVIEPSIFSTVRRMCGRSVSRTVTRCFKSLILPYTSLSSVRVTSLMAAAQAPICLHWFYGRMVALQNYSDVAGARLEVRSMCGRTPLAPRLKGKRKMLNQAKIDRPECWFYHVMDLPELGTVNDFGSWDLRGRFDEYVGGVNLAGKTVLDVGTASGFLTFEAEKRGAIVTSFDVESSGTHVDPGTNAEEKRKENILMQNGYRLAHSLLKSKATQAYGDATSLSKYVTPHDIVLIGQMLVHVRDPIAVIEHAAKVAKEKIIIAEGSWREEAPIAKYVQAYYPGTNSWWHLSTGLYAAALKTFGFKIVAATKAMYQCNHPAVNGPAEIWTFVAERQTAGA